MLTTSTKVAAPPGALHGEDAPVWLWPLVFCGYFLFQALYRRLLGGGLELDEAQMLLWSQHLAWGYGPQPPLYTWLQWGALQIIPDPLLALALLKNIFLAVTYITIFALLRTANTTYVAGVAALSVFLVPQVSWDSQRDMTHSVLVVTMAALATYVFATRSLAGRRGGWAAFGLLTGLGILTKANFVLVPVALVAAALTLKAYRPRVRLGGIALATAIAIAIVAIPADWVRRHPELAFASVRELKMSPGTHSAAEAAATVAEFGGALLSSLGLALLVLAAVGWRHRTDTAGTPTPLDRLLLRTIVIGLLAALAGVLASRSTHVRAMWLLPLLYLSPAVATVWLAPRLGPAGLRLLTRVIAGLAVFVVIALGVRFIYGEPGNPPLSRAPIGALLDEIDTAAPANARIVAVPEWLAGNLLYRRRDLDVAAAIDPGSRPAGDSLLLVWNDRRLETIERRLSEQWDAALAFGPVRPFSAPFPLHPHESFEVAIIPVHPLPDRN